MPPSVPVQSMVIDLVMVTAPKPAGSRQLISPPAAVLEIAPAKVLQGAVRLHGFSLGVRRSTTPGCGELGSDPENARLRAWRRPIVVMPGPPIKSGDDHGIHSVTVVIAAFVME